MEFMNSLGSADSVPITSSGYDERAQGFWSIYVEEAKQHDENMTESWKADMDSTLIFAGLFSATVTAFIIESYKLLQDDSEAAMKDLLTQMLAVQIVSASLNTSTISLPNNVPAASAFQPPSWAIAVNILWFLSLTCSLAAALCVTLVQQWTRDYLRRIRRTNQPQRRATIRAIMFSGTEKWKMDDVVEYIPILLHVSLFLFFMGLCTFLFNVNVATAGGVLAIVVCCLAFYVLVTVVPLIDPAAPYETPFSSLLWHAIPRQVAPMIPAGPRSLSEVRELLADPDDQHSLHRRIHAVSWVYDRTTDDRELQEFLRNIPGLLSSPDGQIAWKDFLDKSSDAIPGLVGRIMHLLEGCSATGYLDYKSRHLRATLCVDALWAILRSSPDFPRSPSRLIRLRLAPVIWGQWEDDGVLATKSLCTSFVAGRQTRLLRIRAMKSFVENGFRDWSNAADQALMDIVDMRQILEDVLRESRSSDLPIQTYKTDISTLLSLYFSVVEAKASVLHRWSVDMQHPDTPQFSCFQSMPSNNIRVIYECALAPSEKNAFSLYAHQMLVYLRLQGLYPAFPETSANTQGLSKTWFPLTELIPWANGDYMRVFRPFDTEISTVIPALPGCFQPIDPGSPVYEGLCRELQPISELLDILDTFPTTTVTVHVDSISFSPLHQQSSYDSLVSLTTQTEGQPRPISSFLEAVIEDKDTVGGLMEFITEIKILLTAGRNFNASIISQFLDNIFPPFSNSNRWTPMSAGSQVLFVFVLREILNWERHLPPKHQTPVSFCDTDIVRLCDMLLVFNHELPVTMAELALGTTLDSPDAIASAGVHLRASHVYSHVMAGRERSNAAREQGETQQITGASEL